MFKKETVQVAPVTFQTISNLLAFLKIKSFFPDTQISPILG